MSISFLILFEFLGAIQKSITLLCYFFNLISQKKILWLKGCTPFKKFFGALPICLPKAEFKSIENPKPNSRSQECVLS